MKTTKTKNPEKKSAAKTSIKVKIKSDSPAKVEKALKVLSKKK